MDHVTNPRTSTKLSSPLPSHTYTTCCGTSLIDVPGIRLTAKYRTARLNRPRSRKYTSIQSKKTKNTENKTHKNNTQQPYAQLTSQLANQPTKQTISVNPN